LHYALASRFTRQRAAAELRRWAAAKMNPIMLFIALVPLSAVGQNSIEGLVEIPALHSRVNSGARGTAIGPVPLFAAPNDTSDVSVVVRDRRELESREHGYEQISAVVYSREANSGGGFWYQVRFIGEGGPSFAWLNQTAAGTYRMVQELVRSGLAFLTADWDGRLFEAPSTGSPAQFFPDLDQRQGVRVIDSYQRGGEALWYLLAIVRGTCDVGPIEVIATGWVPAHSSSGGDTVWYHSRGC
jgi:hypothetical protein